MANAIEVSDSLSNANDQIERAAKAIGSGIRSRVFEAIYFHKSRVKTVAQIVQRTGIERIPVLQHGRKLAGKGIVRQRKVGKETAYEMIDFIQHHKAEILKLARDKKKLAAHPTKWRPVVKMLKPAAIVAKAAKTKLVTIDDIDSFAKVKKIKTGGMLSPTVSEDQFKNGVQSILKEGGVFKDWGGETSDLFSTRLKMKGKRHAVAFAFKGPGLKAKLVPGKMGKNGDQAIRLFREDADVFFAQHWREIDSSVLTLMNGLAVARSVQTGSTVWYGIIDGQDSERLRAAYPDKFVSTGKKKKANAKTKARNKSRR